MRGTFANIRLQNEMVPGVVGGVTRHFPSGDVMPIYDAAMRYKAAGVPLVVVAGKEYGTGSSRDWAAKGPLLLGVKAVLVESFERIHRSNLIGMGVLPLAVRGRHDAEDPPARRHGTGRRDGRLRGDHPAHDRARPYRSRVRRRRGARGCCAASTPWTRWSTTGTAASCSTCCGISPRPSGHPAGASEILADRPRPTARVARRARRARRAGRGHAVDLESRGRRPVAHGGRGDLAADREPVGSPAGSAPGAPRGAGERPGVHGRTPARRGRAAGLSRGARLVRPRVPEFADPARRVFQHGVWARGGAAAVRRGARGARGRPPQDGQRPRPARGRGGPPVPAGVLPSAPGPERRAAGGVSVQRPRQPADPAGRRTVRRAAAHSARPARAHAGGQGLAGAGRPRAPVPARHERPAEQPDRPGHLGGAVRGRTRDAARAGDRARHRRLARAGGARGAGGRLPPQRGARGLRASWNGRGSSWPSTTSPSGRRCGRRGRATCLPRIRRSRPASICSVPP